MVIDTCNWMCVTQAVSPYRGQRYWTPLELESQAIMSCPMGMLGPELRSSAIAVCTLCLRDFFFFSPYAGRCLGWCLLSVTSSVLLTISVSQLALLFVRARTCEGRCSRRPEDCLMSGTSWAVAFPDYYWSFISSHTNNIVSSWQVCPMPHCHRWIGLDTAFFRL